jgi:hypothetical protein
VFVDIREALNLNLTETARELIQDLLVNGIKACVGSRSIIEG